jgi:hypothetical protein
MHGFFSVKMERSKSVSFVSTSINPNEAFLTFVSSFVNDEKRRSFMGQVDPGQFT